MNNISCKKVLRFFKKDVDIDNNIKYECILRELNFNSLHIKHEDIYELYTKINDFIINNDNNNFFMYICINTVGVEPFYIHITFL